MKPRSLTLPALAALTALLGLAHLPAQAIGRLAEETATEQVRVASNRYTMQAALLKDVLNAQNSLAEANHQYQQALLSFWAARADFDKAIGGGDQ